MTLAKTLQIAAGNSQASADVAEAIDFDGTNDFLTRTGGLTGISDGKTFTLSFWLWAPNTTQGQIICNTGSSPQRFSFYVVNNIVNMRGYNSSGSILLQGSFFYDFAINTWNHILVSFDMANTSNRFIYINDVAAGASFNAYENGNIDFTNGDWRIGAIDASTARYKTRFSNVYFDQTYRNLSIEANRRLFITADLKPAADQAALNPILYLPMSDPTAPGVNAGTGGDFTLTGTVARSGRGPNQYNAPYSDLDGAADYLSRTTAPTGIANGKQLTFSYVVQPDTTGEKYVFSIATSTTNRFYIAGNGSAMQIAAWNSAGTVILLAEATLAYTVGRNSVITVSIDLADTAKRHMYVNGLTAASPVWAIYTNDDIQFNVTATPNYRIGSDASTTRLNGRLGAFWFNTSYIDLSVAANLAKFVTGTGIDAKPVDLGANGELPTGTSPLIYLPMYGNNAGKNYGTGGDFTVNSGPYTGARGPNEFWSGSGLFNNPTQTELSALTLNNSPDVTGVTKTTFAVCFKRRDVDVTDNSIIFNTTSSTNNNFHFSVYFNSSEQLVVGWNGHTVATSSAIIDTNWHTLLVSVDSTATVARVYLDNVSVSATITLNRTYTQAFTYVGRATGVSADQCFDGNIGFVYQAHDYIDISQEANRLKFFDAFGYPVNLTQQIEDGAIPAAYIYLLFPESNLGTNNGTAGDFTNNSVTASALVKA